MLLIVEFLTAIVAFYVGINARFMIEVRPLDEFHEDFLLLRAVFYACILLVSMAATGRYQRLMVAGFIDESLRVALSFVIGTVALSLIFYSFPTAAIARKKGTAASVMDD
ncbi:MAG: hypothetical protein HQL71_14100, partial [Magnetococcales bacterium]|nr:hypothetical protein [Magnetococcales bacterium]